MSRKDYELIAMGFSLAKGEVVKHGQSLAAMVGVGIAAEMVADRLALQNSRFDRSRCLKACGFEGGDNA
jgi:hypothetical protein